MVAIIKSIISNVLTALYQPFWFSVLAAVLFMFLCLYAREHGWSQVFRIWVDEFKASAQFRNMFLLAFYTMMILMRTLLNRTMWANPVSNVIGVWGLHNSKGELTTEVLENLILFVPFVFLLLWCFNEKIIGEEMTCKKILRWTTKITFCFSLLIELLQLFLRLGTFQLSDLFYNTLGGLIGGCIYWIVWKIKKKK